MTDDPNRRIGDYEVLGVLGSGGMGKVFKVRNVISDRIEAMKVLLPDLAGQQELAERFLREIKLLASLDHPNIARLRTALTLSNRLVMVMEYVEGTTISARLEQGSIPPAEAVGYVKQVLSALAYAHSRNIIHRDIKPANMMVTPSGTVKLMDFGIARASGDRSMTLTGTTVGSLYYMSPEQVKGSTVDARSDLYSLGVSLYEMVTGQPPFKANSDYSIMTAQLQERPKPPAELRPDLPPQLNGIILHSMAKDPAERFQVAEEFRQALDSLGLIASAPISQAATPVPVSPTPAMAPSITTAAPPISATMSVPAPPPTQAMPAPSVMDLSPKPSRGRGLYMGLGAAVVLLVLVLAGISFPRWMKTRASERQQSEQKQGDQNTQSSSQSGPHSSDSTPSNPPSDSGNSSSPKADDSGSNASSNSNPPASGDSGKSANTGSADNSASSGNSGNGGSTAKNSGDKKPPKAKTSSTGNGTTSGDQSSTTSGNSDQNNASGNSASQAELDELEQDVDQTSSRSNAVSGSLDNMRRSLSAQGLNLRGDIASSEQLMKINLDKAQQALQQHDAKSAKKYLNLAQGNLVKIEKFLGH